MSSTQLLISRRALLQLKPKYPRLFSPPKSTKKPPTETPWPKWMQMAGYTAAAVAVPYTIGVVITQSRILIDQLEGECGTYDDDKNDSIGRKIVSALRWYWGTEDEIPYVDYLEREKLKIGDTSGNDADSFEQEISLENEDHTLWRKNQVRIEREMHSDVKVSLESEGVIRDDVFKGNISLVNQLSSNERNFDPSKGIIVTFQDEDGNKRDGVKAKVLQEIESSIDDNKSNIKQIMKMAEIYDMWHFFPPVQELNSSSIITRSTNWMSPLEIRIEELQHTIGEVQKLLGDPSCTRDRDDMENEIRQMRKEIATLRREKRNAQWKKLIPF